MLGTYILAFLFAGMYFLTIWLGIYFTMDTEKLGAYVRACGIGILIGCVGVAVLIAKFLLS